MECYELIRGIEHIDEGIFALSRYLDAITPTVFDGVDDMPKETINYFIRNINRDIKESMEEAKAIREAMRLMNEALQKHNISKQEIIDSLLGEIVETKHDERGEHE